MGVMAGMTMRAAEPHPNSVPNYDMYGHPHYREPYKDKSYLLNLQIRHPKWLDPAPDIKSRTELMQSRKRGRIPDPSYDFDGDGTVGQLDYFVGRSFDSDMDGRLTRSERGRAEKAVENGFLQKYIRGLEATGDVHRGSLLRQRRGVICSADCPAEASMSTYPPHFNSHKIPEHSTKTAMEISRKAELKGYGARLGEEFAARCAPVPEPQPPTAVTEPRTCAISHIWERAEADHQVARVRAGLLPSSQPMNPERESKAPGLERVEKPYCATRGQLMETRKEAMKRECEDLRAKGDEICVPNSVRRGEQEALEFEFRRPHGEPMTLTRLQKDRKNARIEYDMAHFEHNTVQPRMYPKFSERPDVPFWVADASTFPATGYPTPALSRTVSEPVLKVTDVPFGEEVRDGRHGARGVSATDAPAGKPVSGSAARLGSKTVKRWSTDMIERGQGLNRPRLFDNIQPARIGPRDLESPDLTSSMEPIRSACLKQRALDRKKAADSPRRSKLWNEATDSFDAAPRATGVIQFAPDSPLARKGGRAPKAKSTIVPLTSSEPLLRMAGGPGVLDKTDLKPREPRFFGTVVNTAPRAHSQTGVRCGGFQRFDDSAHTLTAQPAKSRVHKEGSRSMKEESSFG